jgi:hypothetical protein
MPAAPTVDPMSLEQSAVLADFARACKAAARSVSLYPRTHPAIQAALSRVASTCGRLTAAGNVSLTVHPDLLVVDGRAPARPDPAIIEFAALLHERLVGELRINRAVQPEDWHALLLLLGRAPEDLIAAGGIGKAWDATERGHLDLREIDYAEVLRERAGGATAEWDRIIAFCLEGEATTLDERALTSLLDAVSEPAKFGALLDRLQAATENGTSMGARAAALLQLLRTAVDAAEARGAAFAEQVVQTIADSSARLTPEMLLAVLSQRKSPDANDAAVAHAIVDRISEPTVASFVANSVLAERRATERLAQAFEALVPEADRKDRLLEMAGEAVRGTEAGREAGFDELWQGAADMLRSYSDEKYVSDEYAQELTAARTQAVEVERVADDPPDRVRAWKATVSEEALRRLDLDLLLDLLRLEDDAKQWGQVAGVVSADIERRLLLTDFDGAQRLGDAIVREQGAEGRPQLAKAAAATIEQLAAGPFVSHVVLHLRKVDDQGIAALARLCHTIGPGVVRSLAEALAGEENKRVIRALREILVEFGAAGRQSVEQLKNSSNPAVRRAAIDLLRVFGGNEALPELASMLGDADPEVQREAVRAIVHIGTPEAYAVLERALLAGSAARETIVQQLLGMREDKAAPMLCYILNHTQPRGKLAQAHAEIIDALGSLKPHPESTRTLRTVLHRGEWWAPFRTAALRQAAAAALARIGSPETAAVLEEAARTGSRGVRKIARARAGAAARRERERT